MATAILNFPITKSQSFFPSPPQLPLVGFQHSRVSLQTTRRRALRLLADPNVSSGSKSSKKEVVMVDPAEAKRLAAKQMQEIKAVEKLEREGEIEAINGAWAMLGLTAALVIEGKTGKGILGQLNGYVDAIAGLFPR